MSRAVFGKEIRRSFIADDGSQYLTLPTQNPIIYVFDYAPSYEQAIAGTNAIETITSWEQTASAELTYTISPISDPDPAGALIEREYWECILYKLTTGAQTQHKLRMFTLNRADVISSIPNVSSEDIAAVWPAFSNYITPAQLSAFLPVAEAEMRSELGLAKWGRLSHLGDSKIALAYKTIEMMAASQVVKGNSDKFLWMVEYFGAKYSSLKGRLELPIDVDGDGKPDENVQTNSSVVFSSR